MIFRTSVLKGLAFVAVGALTFAACDDKDPVQVDLDPVTVTVVPTTATIPQGGTLPVGVTVTNAQNPAVTWRTSNAAVATVSATGVITAVSPGNALISAVSVQDTTARAHVSVTVTAVVPPTITLTPPTGTVGVGGTLQLVAVVTGAANTGVTFRSAAPNIASVNATTGLVTGVAPGTAVITALANADTTRKATATITVTPTSGNLPVVTVTPAAAQAIPGGTVQFVANVTNAANTAVTWRSSVPFVTVSSSGLATVATNAPVGQVAVITALSAADTLARGSATLTVIAPPAQPSVSIQSVVPAAGGNLNPANVSGQIVATVNVSAVPEADIRAVEVRVDGTQVCRQTFSQPLGTTQGVAVITCTINTAAVDTLTGQPLFPNGVHTLSAVAINGAGSVITEAVFQPLTFNNVNTVNGTVTFDNTLVDGDNVSDNPTDVDAAGNVWFGGAATVRLSAAVFSGNQVSTFRVVVDLNCNGVADGGEPARTTPAVSGGFASITFSEAASTTATTPGIDNVEDGSVCFLVTGGFDANNASVPLAAATGNVLVPASPLGNLVTVIGATQQQFRVDNVEPPVPTSNIATIYPGGFIGAGAAMNISTAASSSTAEYIDITDGGVGRVTAEFRVVRTSDIPAGTTNISTYVAANGTLFTNAAELAAFQSTSNQEVTIVATLIDALGNRRNLAAVQLGVDLTPPAITDVVLPDSINDAPSNINVAAADTLSGFPVNLVQIRILKVTATAPTRQCATAYDTGTGNYTFVNEPTAGCSYFGIPTLAPALPDDEEAYYIISLRVVDIAGNTVQAFTDEVFLIDTTNPAQVVTGFSVAGSNITVTGTQTDNVDLLGSDVRLGFTGATPLSNLPFSNVTAVGSFGLPLTTTAAASGTAPLIRSVQNGIGGGVVNLSTAGFGTFDIAGNFSFSGIPAGSPTPSDGIPGSITAFDLAPTTANLCAFNNSGSPCSAVSPTAPGSVTLTASAVTASTVTTSPIARTFFYYVHPDGHAVLLGVDNTASLQVIAGDPNRYWNFTQNLTPSLLDIVAIGDESTVTIYALGVDAQGDAVFSNASTVTLR